jgi:hypothetical protein
VSIFIALFCPFQDSTGGGGVGGGGGIEGGWFGGGNHTVVVGVYALTKFVATGDCGGLRIFSLSFFALSASSSFLSALGSIT